MSGHFRAEWLHGAGFQRFHNAPLLKTALWEQNRDKTGIAIAGSSALGRGKTRINRDRLDFDWLTIALTGRRQQPGA